MMAAGSGGAIIRWNPFWTCVAAIFGAVLAAYFGVNSGVIVSLVIAGLAMGMPFVAGVNAWCSEGRSRSVAFLISGLGSGIGGYFAVVISLVWGFPAVLFTACAGYALAAMIARFNRA
jgi:hypothetical protein